MDASTPFSTYVSSCEAIDSYTFTSSSGTNLVYKDNTPTITVINKKGVYTGSMKVNFKNNSKSYTYTLTFTVVCSD